MTSTTPSAQPPETARDRATGCTGTAAVGRRAVSEREWQRLLRRARRHVAKLSEKIDKAATNGRWEQARRLRNLYLRSYDAKLVAAVHANRKLPRHRRKSREDLIESARTLDPWTGTDEEVRLIPVPKRGGDHRPIASFGIRHRTLQMLTRRAMEGFAASRVLPGQYDRRGGRPAACRAVRDALANGCKWEVQLDITNCFGSIDPEGVRRRLPLPKRVIGAVILAENHNQVVSHHHGLHTALGLLNRGRQGIPQGSAVSPLVAEMLLASIPSELPEGARYAMYADNIIVLTRTEREAASILETLRAALERHPAGPLRLSKREIRRASWGFEFLGYRFKLMRGTPQIEPTASNTERFRRGFRERRCAWRTDGNRAGRLRNYVKSSAATFRLWDHAEAFEACWLRDVDRIAAERPALVWRGPPHCGPDRPLQLSPGISHLTSTAADIRRRFC